MGLKFPTTPFEVRDILFFLFGLSGNFGLAAWGFESHFVGGKGDTTP